MHEALGGVETQVLQYHGFSLANQPGYPNVVLSNGSAQPHRGLYLLKTALEAQGETVGIYDGQNWKALGATSGDQAAGSAGRRGESVRSA